jgi:ankyrin repeat protein
MQQFFQKTVDTKTEALVSACMNGDIEVVKKLIADGADINTVDPQYGDTALAQAAFKGRIAIVDYCLKNCFVSPHCKNISLILASQAGQTEIAAKFIKCGADVNAEVNTPQFYYQPPVQQAIEQNKNDVFLLLLNEKNININFEDKFGRTALLIASDKGDLCKVKELIKNGASPSIKNSKGFTARSVAELKKHSEIINYFDTLTSSNIQTLKQ